MMNAREVYGMGPAPTTNKAEFMNKAAAFMDGLMAGAAPAKQPASTTGATKTEAEKREIVNGMLAKLATDKDAQHKKGLETMSKVLDNIFNK